MCIVSGSPYNTAPGSVPVSRRRSGTPGGASIDDSLLANIIFDTVSKPSGGGGGGGGGGAGNGGGVGSNLQKSPHHKSTSALSDVQTNVATSPSGKRSSTTSTSYSAASSSSHAGRAHTLAVTESSSYLSSIGGSGFADDYEAPSPPSSGFNSANTSFSSSHANNHSTAHGYSGGGSGGGGLRGNFDLADEYLHHIAGGGGGGSHSSSPTGYSNSSHSSSSGYHHHRSDVAAGSPVTHYKRASSPVLTFPTENQKSYVAAGHADRVGGGGRHAYHSHAQDIARSRSPDLQQHRLMTSSSYHPPSMLDQPAAAYRHQSVHHHSSRGGGVSPTMYVQGQMGTGRDHQQGKGWIEDRKSPVQRYQGVNDYPHGHNKMSPNSQVRNPNHHSSMIPVKDPSGYRGNRKASDQEMGIMEALSMMDKRSIAAASKLDDGTLV